MTPSRRETFGSTRALSGLALVAQVRPVAGMNCKYRTFIGNSRQRGIVETSLARAGGELEKSQSHASSTVRKAGQRFEGRHLGNPADTVPHVCCACEEIISALNS